jgi:hypothetical protein
MRKTYLSIGTGLCLLAFTLSVGAQTQRKPGLYEVTTTMNMGGASAPQMPQLPPGVQLPPGMQMPGGSMAAPRTMQVCVTQAMIDKYGGPSPAPQRGNCQVTDVSIKPNGMTAKINCTGQITGTGTVEATYTDANTTQSKMHMSGTMQMGQNSHPVDMTVNSTSVYKGADCGSVKPFAMPGQQ